MAQFTKVNSDFKPVLNYDSAAYTNTGLNATTANVAVQPQGPKLDFFTITANGSGTFSGANVLTITQTLEQLSSIYLYEYSNAAPDTFSVALYPTQAWTTTTINTAIQGAGIASTSANSATFTTTVNS